MPNLQKRNANTALAANSHEPSTWHKAIKEKEKREMVVKRKEIRMAAQKRRQSRLPKQICHLRNIQTSSRKTLAKLNIVRRGRRGRGPIIQPQRPPRSGPLLWRASLRLNPRQRRRQRVAVMGGVGGVIRRRLVLRRLWARDLWAEAISRRKTVLRKE